MSEHIDIYGRQRGYMDVKKRIITAMLTLAIGSCVIVLASSIWIYSIELSNSMFGKIDIAENVVVSEIAETKAKVYMTVRGLVNHRDLIEALEKNDRNRLVRLADNVATVARLDYCTILDSEGTVIARSHVPDSYGDNLANQPHVMAAMSGYIEAHVMHSTYIRLGVSAGTPIRDENGNTLGIVTAGIRMDVSDFAMHLKALTGCDIGIFFGDERVSTTLMNEDGTPSLGTKAPPYVIETVFAGEVFTGRTMLLDNRAITRFIPIHDMNNDVIGMVCIGYMTAEDSAKIQVFVISGALVTLGVIILGIILARFISTNMERRLTESLRQQTLMTTIANNFLSDESVDKLFTDTLRLVGEFMGAARVLLYKVDEDGGAIECQHEWLAPNQELATRIGYRVAFEKPIKQMFNGFLNREEGNRCLISDDPVVREAIGPFRSDRHDYITAPIYNKRRICAILDLSRMNEGREWSKSDIDLVGLVESIFSGVYEREAIVHDLDTVTKLKADLSDAMEIAERSNRAKSEFLSRTSHEMLTPLNSIMGILQIAMMQPENASEYLPKINSAAFELKSILHDVLDISGMEYGVFKLTDSKFSLRMMMYNVVQDATRYAREKKQTIRSYVNDNLPSMFLGDEKRLYQVVQNLMMNAVKFTPEHGVIQIEAHEQRDEVGPQEKDGRITVRIEVSDNGIGIPKERQDTLFEMFEQVDGGNTRKYGGLGIGLALSKRIVEMMDGDIRVVSEEDKGAKFTFTCKLKIAG
jgi:signal transduction histidine kinase